MDMKFCVLCRTDQPLSEFHRKKRSPDGLQSKCKSCTKINNARYYADNTAKHKAAVTARGNAQREVLRRYVCEYLSTHPCLDCGNTDIRVLEFDHVRGEKLYNVSSIVGAGFSLKKLQDEIAKCEVRCANCHRIKTRERAGNTWKADFALLEKTSLQGMMIE